MENNEFKEGTMELLGSLLSAKECHIQMLRYGHTLTHIYTTGQKFGDSKFYYFARN